MTIDGWVVGLLVNINQATNERVCFMFGANLISILVTFPANSASLPQFIEGVSISR